MLFTAEQLAQQIGVAVRTLHRYDATGLLVPSGHCESGGRRYNQKDIIRLYRILGLRRLGLSLARIGTVLAENRAALTEIIDLHRLALDQQIASAQELHGRLAGLHERIALGGEPNLNEWLTTLELMNMYEGTFAVEQTNRFTPIVEGARDEWPALIAAVRSALERGLSPHDREVQYLAQRWMDLLRDTATRDPMLFGRYARMNRTDSGEPLPSGVDMPMLDYLSAALWAKHLTLDEMARLRKDGPKQHAWPGLIAAFREEMNRGTAVGSPRVQELFRQWECLLDDLTQGDAALSNKWFAAVRSDPDLWIGAGVDGRLQHYIQRARVAMQERVG